MNSHTEQTAPWHDLIHYIPAGFSLDLQGLYRIGRGEPEWIADPCWISADTRGIEGGDAGTVVSWLDPHTQTVSAIPIPKRRFFESGNTLIRQLADAGLQIVPGSEKMLLRYLGSFRLPVAYRSVSSSRIGWCPDPQNHPIFVLPQQTIGYGGGASDIVFQPDGQPASARSMQPSGSLQAWQHHVANRCTSHPLLVFALSAAFAGPLMRLARLDSGGFHFFGASSKGKTTLLQVAASVWGSGADTAVSHESYMNRWNSTANAFEATAAAYNDLLLPLDELGTCDAKDVGKVIYDLFGGRGKSRLNKESALQDQRTWLTLALSTGEISIRDKVQDNTSRRPHAGQLARMSDIAIPEMGVVETTDQKAAKALVQELKESCARCYGVAGPTFLDRLINQFTLPDSNQVTPTITQISDLVTISLDRIESTLTIPELETHHQRVLRRMAIVACAGLLAAELGVLPICSKEILAATTYVRDLWLSDDENLPEDARGISAIREFILHNEDRFRDAKDESNIVHNLVGYKTPEAGKTARLYLLTPDTFSEICRNNRCNPKIVIQAIRKRGFLYLNEKTRYTSKHTVDGMGRPYFYAIRAAIVNGEEQPEASEAVEANAC